MRIIYRSVLVLVAIWAIAVSAIFVIRSLQPTPQKFMSYVAEHSLEGLEAPKREEIINHAAQLLNRLSFEQRQELKESGAIRSFLAQLTAEERQRFFAMTLPEGFRQLIATLNKMDPGQRRRLAQRTLRNMRERNFQVGDFGGEDEIARMISQGLVIFNEKADLQVRRDFSQVIEELERKQKTSQSSREAR